MSAFDMIKTNKDYAVEYNLDVLRFDILFIGINNEMASVLWLGSH